MVKLTSETAEFFNQLKKQKKIIRLILLGDGAVGKTSLINKVLEYTSESECNQAIPLTEDEDTKRTPFLNIESWYCEGLTIQSYDLAGQREPGAHPIDLLRTQVFGRTDIIIYVFSLNRFESFENLYTWKELVESEDTQNNSLHNLLVGNKLDLEKKVTMDFISPLVGNGNVFERYIETSAKENIGIKDLINAVVEIGSTLFE